MGSERAEGTVNTIAELDTLGLELNGVDRNLAITPQLRKGLTRTGAIAVAGGIQIPLNNREFRRLRWVGYFLWEYLDPVFAVKN